MWVVVCDVPTIVAVKVVGFGPPPPPLLPPPPQPFNTKTPRNNATAMTQVALARFCRPRRPTNPARAKIVPGRILSSLLLVRPLVVRVSVVVEVVVPGTILIGEKSQLAPFGNPEQLNDTNS